MHQNFPHFWNMKINLYLVSFHFMLLISLCIHQEKIKYINRTKCRCLYFINLANFGCILLVNSIKHKPLTISEECSPLLSVYTRHVGRVSNSHYIVYRLCTYFFYFIRRKHIISIFCKILIFESFAPTFQNNFIS